MSERATRSSILLTFYKKFQRDGNEDRFASLVNERLTAGTLERLLISGDIRTQRAAAAALGAVGESTAIPAIGPKLKSKDRRLRMVADEAMQSIISREGSGEQQMLLNALMKENVKGNHSRAYELATEMLDRFGNVAEVYHQRSLAAYNLDRTDEAILDCFDCLKSNAFHYAAMVGLGFCYLDEENPLYAMHWFRQALDVYPDLEPVRVQIEQLERQLTEDGVDFDGSESA